MANSAQNPHFDAFYRESSRRVRRYVAALSRMHGIGSEHLEDCLQAAYCEAALALRYWQPTGGKSAFNWAAGPMRRGVLRCHRAALGSRPYGSDPVLRWSTYRDRYGSIADDQIAERIDLHRALAADPKPQQIMRLIMLALSVSTGADMAQEQGITKQTMCEHLRKTRERLRLQLSM